jgi:plastocyanin
MAGARRGAALTRRAVVGSGAAFAAAPAWAAPRVHTVAIRDMAFGPAPAPLRVGDVVEWLNADIFRHTATARDRSFDLDLPPKGRARTTLKSAGTIEVYCRYHPGMTVRLAVAR